MVARLERRFRRTASPYRPHDAVWRTDVPADHKLWSDGQKVTLSLSFSLGGTWVGKLLLRMETLNYRFGLLVNVSIVALQAVKEELTALWMMELQDRLVLDQLTASQGGVCCHGWFITLYFHPSE